MALRVWRGKAREVQDAHVDSGQRDIGRLTFGHAFNLDCHLERAARGGLGRGFDGGRQRPRAGVNRGMG